MHSDCYCFNASQGLTTRSLFMDKILILGFQVDLNRQKARLEFEFEHTEKRQDAIVCVAFFNKLPIGVNLIYLCYSHKYLYCTPAILFSVANVACLVLCSVKSTVDAEIQGFLS